MIKQMYKYLGLGWILGCFSNLVVFVYFGYDALWVLSIFCVVVLVLSLFLHVNKEQKKEKRIEPEENKTLGKRLRIWK